MAQPIWGALTVLPPTTPFPLPVGGFATVTSMDQAVQAALQTLQASGATIFAVYPFAIGIQIIYH